MRSCFSPKEEDDQMLAQEITALRRQLEKQKDETRVLQAQLDLLGKIRGSEELKFGNVVAGEQQSKAMTDSHEAPVQLKFHDVESELVQSQSTAESDMKDGRYASTLEKIRQQISEGARRRDEQFLEKVFVENATEASFIPDATSLGSAFQALNYPVASQEELTALFLEFDTNHDGKINMDEFKNAVSRPSTIGAWAKSIPLWQVLSDAIPLQKGVDPVRTASNLTTDELDLVWQAFTESAKILFTNRIADLKRSFQALDQKKLDQSNAAASKFQTFKASCGNVEDFHKGIIGRIGSPHIKFFQAMRSEHCVKEGCDVEFETSNYHIVTTPAKEWMVIVEGSECPEANMTFSRVIKNIDECMRLSLSVKARLLREEVIAVVLYTGPMFTVINSILRQYPRKLYRIFERARNLFATTIFVLVSAVQKISRVMKIPDGTLLYRGLGGLIDLPDSFFRSDDHGCRGYAEWAFMSTTSSKSVALEYSGVKEGRPLPMVLEISIGAVDRGACIRDFSQYPQEIEYLWPPCSFLQPVGESYIEPTEDGPVQMIKVRVNANVKTMTVEQIRGQKKEMHIAAFSYLLEEIRRDIEQEEQKFHDKLARDPSAQAVRADFDTFSAMVIDQCEQIFKKQAERDDEDFIADEQYRGMVIEMLEVKKMARSMREWYYNEASAHIFDFKDMTLREAHRFEIARLQRCHHSCTDETEKAKLALELCKLKGLVVETASEENEQQESKLFEAVAAGWKEEDIKLLIAAGAQLKRNAKGETEVMAAAKNGNASTVQVLQALGADVNAAALNGATAVTVAAHGGHTAAVQALIELDADVNAVDDQGWTAIIKAAVGGHAETVQVLLAAGADVNAAEEHGSNAMMFAAQSGHTAAVRALVAGGANVNFGNVNSYGMAPIHFAAHTGKTETIIALGELGADLDLATSRGMTAVKIAAQEGHTRTVAALLDMGINPSAGSDGLTLLMHAAQSGEPEMIRLVHSASANVNAQSEARGSRGFTPLMFAACYGRTAAAMTLLSLGADAAITNVGRTAAEWADCNDHPETAQAIRDWVASSPAELNSEFCTDADDA